jgi:hypothetical protein
MDFLNHYTKLNKSNLLISYVSNHLIDKLYQIKSNLTNYDYETPDQVITKNCYLSKNQITKLDWESKKEIAGPNFHYGSVHHLHILEFPKNGILDYHHHHNFEYYSYVIYMDDIGGTEFLFDDTTFLVPSEKGKIVWFPSEIMHRAITNGLPRIVAAGGIIKK